MSELEELLASAGGRWRSAELRATHWATPTYARSWAMAWLEESGVEPVTTGLRLVVDKAGALPEWQGTPPVTPSVSSREDEEAGGRVFTRVIDGQRWWAHTAPDEILLNDGTVAEFFLAPGPALRLLFADDLPGACSLDVVGEGTRAGRTVLTVRARPGSTEDGPPFCLAVAGENEHWRHDEYLLDVDAERGVLLAVTGSLGGEPRQGIIVEEISFDGPIDRAVFRAQPPPGVAVRRCDEPFCH